MPACSVSLLDADDVAEAGWGGPVADLVVLAGVSADAAARWVDRLTDVGPAALPVALVTKNVHPDLDRQAGNRAVDRPEPVVLDAHQPPGDRGHPSRQTVEVGILDEWPGPRGGRYLEHAACCCRSSF